jgi:hypothetical protein
VQRRNLWNVALNEAPQRRRGARLRT